jgi:hypothetical protein
MIPEQYLVEHEPVIEPWNRFFNPLIMNVFETYDDSKDNTLFGITGDLDCLGLYVATNGRAKAENLVDFYNQTIRNYLSIWLKHNPEAVGKLAFVPSGEEVLIVGTAIDKTAVADLFLRLRPAVTELTSKQEFIDIDPTAASFGGVLFSREYDQEIAQMVLDLRLGASDEVVYPQYLQVLESMRTQMALALDVNKFGDIFPEHPVEARNMVYTQMLDYKTKTKNILISLARVPPEELTDFFQCGGPSYGVTEEQVEKIQAFLARLNI